MYNVLIYILCIWVLIYTLSYAKFLRDSGNRHGALGTVFLCLAIIGALVTAF